MAEGRVLFRITCPSVNLCCEERNSVLYAEQRRVAKQRPSV